MTLCNQIIYKGHQAFQLSKFQVVIKRPSDQELKSPPLPAAQTGNITETKAPPSRCGPTCQSQLPHWLCETQKRRMRSRREAGRSSSSVVSQRVSGTAENGTTELVVSSSRKAMGGWWARAPLHRAQGRTKGPWDRQHRTCRKKKEPGGWREDLRVWWVVKLTPWRT